jgi:hypothetical protein
MNPVQHWRMRLWGGLAGMSVAVLVSALILGMSISPERFSLGGDRTAQAIQPPALTGGVPIDPTPTPVRRPTPTPEPTPTINLALQAELLSVAMTPAAELGSGDCLYVAETQHNICGTFRTFFNDHGGSAIFGNPLSEQYIIDGKPVQYFERARFEWTAGTNGQPDYVLLSRLGAHQRMAEVGQEIDPPAVPLEHEGCLYEDVTRHNICDDFAYHWVATGGPMIHGLPITEAFERDGVLIQYFERARFEFHHFPDGTTGVVAGPLGTEEIIRLLESVPAGEESGSGG